MALPIDQNVGFAFSGGGIRSASFSSGVLKRFVKVKQHRPRYVSCVSGGGYLGSAYVQHSPTTEAEHDAFFKMFGENIGYYLSFNTSGANPNRHSRSCRPSFLRGCCAIYDLIVLLGYALILTPIFFVFTILPTGFILTTALDYCFGGIILQHLSVRPPIVKSQCLIPFGDRVSSGFDPTWFIFIFFFSGVLCYFAPVLDCCCKSSARVRYWFIKIFFTIRILGLGLVLLAVLLSMTLFGVDVNTYVDDGATIAAGLLAILIAAAPMFFGGIVGQSFTMFVIAIVYGKMLELRVVRGQCGHTILWSITYSEEAWRICLIISWVVLLASPVFNNLRIHAFNTCYAWRLQRAFFKRAQNDRENCYSPFLLASLCGAKYLCPSLIQAADANPVPSMEDLGSNNSTEYIANMTVSNWKVTADDPLSYIPVYATGVNLVAIRNLPNSPSYDFDCVERDAAHDDNSELSHLLRHSPAIHMTAASAAALSASLGEWDSLKNSIAGPAFIDFASASMGRWENTRSRPVWPCRGCARFMHAIPPEIVCATIYTVIVGILLLVYGIPQTANETPASSGPLINLVMTCINLALVVVSPIFGLLFRNLPMVRITFLATGVFSISEEFPDHIHLSDGGHSENLAFLSLLKIASTTTIYICDGSHDTDREGKALFAAMEIARKELGYSFYLHHQANIYYDMRTTFREGFTKVPTASSFKFMARRFDNLHQPVGLEITCWYLRPAEHPAAMPNASCCCECCNHKCCRPVLACCFGAFPNHSTANQFFTPGGYDLYHAAGGRSFDATL